jgi:prephenate dehydrogenase
MERISIIGLGLIGGSLGMALCRTNQVWVWGYDLSDQACVEALERKAVHEVASDFQTAISEADLVILAVPVEKIKEVIKESSSFFRSGAIITDVASTKGRLARIIPPLLPRGVYYVGGHPMTGAERSGIFAADPFLFQNAVYLLTPEENIPRQIVDKLCHLITMVGGLPLLLKPEEHDLMVAVVSHLPHLLAAALVNVAARFNQEYPGTLSLAAGGFHDTTRVAMGSPSLWREIFNSNRTSLLKVIKEFTEELQGFCSQLSAKEMELVEKRLNQAAVVRSELPAKNKGFLTLLYELVVVIEDRPGTIAEVTGILKDLNIKDIEILRVREGEGGTLRLAFDDEQTLGQAVSLLRARDFTVRVRGKERG